MSHAKIRREIVLKIKEKRELAGLVDSVVENILDDFLRKNRISLPALSEKEKKIIVKEVRSTLRLLAGRFRKSAKKKNPAIDLENINELLRTHSSTAERLDFYPQFREKLLEMKPASILDLGCGLNPIALSLRGVVYYASDINTKDLSIISAYFKKHRIKGKTFVLDLQKMDSPLPNADITLLLKLLDVIDPKHTLSENIINKIPSRRIIVSFSTRKLSGRKMNFPRRYWFEKLLSKLHYHYYTIETDNEIFYFITKP